MSEEVFKGATFQVGDKVELLTNWFKDPSAGSLLTIVERCYTPNQWIDSSSVEIEQLEGVEKDFKLLKATDILVDTTEHEYQGLKWGNIYSAYITSDNRAHFKANGKDWVLCESEYLLYVSDNISESEQQEKKDVNSRKVGKNRMELIDTGFPNAMIALGEVATWASENKGYGDNDWKNISSSFNAFVGAASRHRNKRFAGVEFDEESNLPHLYHEAFNVLAQLELYIEGKLK